MGNGKILSIFFGKRENIPFEKGNENTAKKEKNEMENREDLFAIDKAEENGADTSCKTTEETAEEFSCPTPEETSDEKGEETSFASSEEETESCECAAGENTAEPNEEKPAAGTGAENSAKTENIFIKIEESTEYKKLEKEYKEYRQKKVLSHIDAMILPNLPQSEIKQELQETVRAEKGSVCVFPQMLKQAKKELPQIIKVSVLINYPFAGSEKDTVLSEVKAAMRAKANSAVVCINLSSFLSGNSKLIDKELKVLKKYSSKIQVVPLFPAQGLSLEQASKLAALVKVNMIARVGIALDAVMPNVDKAADVIKIFYNVLGEQCPIDVYGSICSAEAAETLFNADADRVITTEYRALSRQRLDGVEVK